MTYIAPKTYSGFDRPNCQFRAPQVTDLDSLDAYFDSKISPEAGDADKNFICQMTKLVDLSRSLVTHHGTTLGNGVRVYRHLCDRMMLKPSELTDIPSLHFKTEGQDFPRVSQEFVPSEATRGKNADLKEVITREWKESREVITIQGDQVTYQNASKGETKRS